MFDNYPDIVKVTEVQQMIRRGKKTVYALFKNKEIKADRPVTALCSLKHYIIKLSCNYD